VFYLWSSVLLGLAMGFVVWALLRPTRAGTSKVSRQRMVTALYRDRLQELRGEVSDSQIDGEARADLEQELGAALLTDYAEETDEVFHASGNVGLAAMSAGLLMVGALLVYQLVGDPAALQLSGAEEILQMDPSQDAEALDGWRQQLVDRVDSQPGDAESWYLLGHVDLKLNRFPSAAEAFAMAHAGHGDDPSIDVFWLQARYLASKGQVDASSRVIADRILERDPNQPMVLEMYAIEAYRRADFRESVSLFNRALAGRLQPTHRTSLAAGYQEARTRLGDVSPSIDVVITTAPDVPHGATLFVIARPIGGGIPFAVVKRPAIEFPRTVRLDDAVSMNPAAPLSSVDAVELVVRISLAGTAMAHPGDWEWRSGPITLSGQTETLNLAANLTAPGE